LFTSFWLFGIWRYAIAVQNNTSVCHSNLSDLAPQLMRDL
jgi:hypothetical protein